MLPPESLPTTRMERRSLRRFERFAIPFMEWLNLRPWPKATVSFFGRHISARWVYYAQKNLIEATGLEHVRDLDPEAGVILASNHRSFFDMYVTVAMLYHEARFQKRLFFPVRSNFFYDSPLGMFVNMSISGGSMWPPIFRDDRRELFNPVGVAQLEAVLRLRGAVVGIHPEGTRGKGPDPYEFLPARPGIGHLVRAAPPGVYVVPYFILGLGNDIVAQMRRNFRPPGQRGAPVRIRFAPPIEARTLQGVGTPQEIADEILERIAVLGEADRAAHPEEAPARRAMRGQAG